MRDGMPTHGTMKLLVQKKLLRVEDSTFVGSVHASKEIEDDCGSTAVAYLVKWYDTGAFEWVVADGTEYTVV